MKLWRGIGLSIVAVIFWSGCQDEGEEPSTENTERGGVSEITNGGAAEAEEVEVGFDFRKYLVGVATLRNRNDWDVHVGLGFRLAPESKQVYVAYLESGSSKKAQIFVDERYSRWSPGLPPWKENEEGNLRVIAYPTTKGMNFPLLSEYEDLLAGDEQESAWLAAAGEDLFKKEGKDSEMQKAMDEESAELLTRIEKYQEEQRRLRTSRERGKDRMRSAVDAELNRAMRDLAELKARGQRLGLRVRTGEMAEILEKKVAFTEKSLPLENVNKEETPHPQPLGVVVAGGLALMEGGRVTRRLSAQEWPEALRLKMEDGQVWFSSSSKSWFVKTRFLWSGFDKQKLQIRYEFLPLQDGVPEEESAFELEGTTSYLDFPLSSLLKTNKKQFRCRLTIEDETLQTFVRTFDFEIGEGADGKVGPIRLESEDLRVEPDVRRRDSDPKNAKLLKTLQAGGSIKEAVSYQGGRRLLLRIANPAKIKVLDTEGMKWIKEWDLSGEKLVTTSNGSELFVFDPVTNTMARQGLGDLKELAKVNLEEGEEVLAMGIGTEVVGAPLLLVYRNRLELRHPETLAVLEKNLQQPANSYERTPAAARTEFPDHAGRFVVYADPLGEAFSVSFLSDVDEYQESKTIVVSNQTGRWSQVDWNSYGNVSRAKLISTGNSFRSVYQDARNLQMNRLNGSIVYHTPGRGFMGCEARISRTIPPDRIKISYLPWESGESIPLCFAAAQAMRHLTSPQLKNQSRIRDFLPIHVLPEQGKIVSLGESEVVFEEIPAGSFPPKLVLEQTPSTLRGVLWEYQPRTNDGSVPDYEIVKAPEGMTYSKDFGFRWQVPPGFPKNVAFAEVKPLGEGEKTVFTIPVRGEIITSLTDLSADSKQTSMPVLAKHSFETSVGEIETVRSHDVILVTTNASRSLRVIDLATGKSLGALESPAGPMVARAIHDGVLICYLDGMVMERRSLPDLTLQNSAGSGGRGRLVALVAGKVTDSGQPFGLFDEGGPVHVVRELDLGTLKFGAEGQLKTFWTHMLDQFTSGWVKASAPSADGRMVWLGNRLLIQTSPGNYTFFDQAASSFSNQGPFFTNAAGTTFFSNRGAMNRTTKQTWQPPSGQGAILLPDDREEWILNVKFSSSIGRRGPVNNVIEIYDPVTNSVRYRVEGLGEWNVHQSNLVRGIPAFSRVSVCGSDPHLVTLSASGTELFIRKLSIQKD